MWKVCLFAVSGAIYRGIHHVTEWWWCFVSQGHQSNLAEFETKLHVDSLTKQACRFDYKHIIQHKGNVPRSHPWWLIHRNLHPFWFFARGWGQWGWRGINKEAKESVLVWDRPKLPSFTMAWSNWELWIHSSLSMSIQDFQSRKKTWSHTTRQHYATDRIACWISAMWSMILQEASEFARSWIHIEASPAKKTLYITILFRDY